MVFAQDRKYCNSIASSVLLVCIILLAASVGNYAQANTTSEPHTANALWMEPRSILTTDSADAFNVTIWLNLTEKCFAWQLKIHYNATYFNVTRVGYTNVDRSAFFAEHSTVSVLPTIDNDAGFILCGESLLAADERNPGYGSLVWVEFNLKETPPANQFNLSFSEPYGIDTFILNPYLETVDLETVEGAAIHIVAAPPLLLYVAILSLASICVVSAVIVTLRKRRRGLEDVEELED